MLWNIKCFDMLLFPCSPILLPAYSLCRNKIAIIVIILRHEHSKLKQWMPIIYLFQDICAFFFKFRFLSYILLTLYAPLRCTLFAFRFVLMLLYDWSTASMINLSSSKHFFISRPHQTMPLPIILNIWTING